MNINDDYHQKTLSGKDRGDLLDSHPIISKDYTVLTPMIQKTYALIRERVWSRRTGSFLYARPRTGKTRCAIAIQRLLAAEFPDIHVMFLSADQRTNASDLGFVLDLLSSEDLVLKKHFTYKEALLKLLTHIETQLSARAGNHLVLLIDEQQLLCEADYRLLLVIHNRLELKKISMTTLGFGQPQILTTITALSSMHSYNLIARFLSEPIIFDGCQNENELEVILVAYDEEKRFPENTDWTYTRFFLPEAYAAGFRLKTYAPNIWKSLNDASGSLPSNTVPMEHLIRTIEYILLASRKLDGKSFELDNKIIDAAVGSSNLRFFSSLIH